jgi:aryl-alcohol dehydrogenase-like predicted oxidoreductase
MATVLVGVRNTEQVQKNAAAMVGQIDDRIFERMTEISERVMAKIPDTGNIFRFYPGRAKPHGG